ncbi:hypothetical protein ACHHYP_20621 [Achlya hypogyna]|uniref:Uncharacterized protein n=1 Tax=Achlya hypogyna TaxID=1202772 RepID=A0A1V9YH07_ACHHY|nr:hypothetical protein ACHHYP_20621 [Achlya hypogyna]
MSSPPKHAYPDFLSQLQVTTKPSPYAGRVKRARRLPAALAPLPPRDDLALDIAFAESQVTKTILIREDLVQQVLFLCRRTSSPHTTTAALQGEQFAAEDEVAPLIERLGEATKVVVLAIDEWCRVVGEKDRHAKQRATPNFRWQVLTTVEGDQLHHTLHMDDASTLGDAFRDARLSYSALHQYLQWVGSMLPMPENKSSFPQLCTVHIFMTQSIVASVDIFATTTLADVRRHLRTIADVPVAYRFWYRDATVSRSTEAHVVAHNACCGRRILLHMHTAAETRRAVFAPNATNTYHNWLFPDERSSLQRDVDAQAERRRLAAVPAPRTHWVVTIEIDVPAHVVGVEVAASGTTTIQHVFEALLNQHHWDFVSSHDALLNSEDDKPLDLSTRLGACGVGHDGLIRLRHRRIDVIVPCAALFDVLVTKRAIRATDLSMTALRALPLDVFVTVVYDALCSAFPTTQGITNVKFATFLKQFKLHSVLGLATAASVHAYFELHLLPGQTAYLKAQFKSCLFPIGQATYQKLTATCAAQPLPKTPNEFILHFFYGWGFQHGPMNLKTLWVENAIVVAMNTHARRHCSAMRLQAFLRKAMTRGRYRRLRWRTVQLQAAWRRLVLQRAFVIALALHRQAVYEERRRIHAIVLVCFIRRRLRKRKVDAKVRQEAQRRAEIAALLHERRQRRNRGLERRRAIVAVASKAGTSTRLLVTALRRADTDRVWIQAYDPSTSVSHVLTLDTAVLGGLLGLSPTAPMTMVLAAVAPRLQLVAADTLRLSVKPITYRRGERVYHHIRLLPTVTLNKSAFVVSRRFMIEAYRSTGIVVIRVYNPRDSFVWQTSETWQSQRHLLELLSQLYVRPTGQGRYTIESKANVQRALRLRIATVCQSHYRRKRDFRIAVARAQIQWLRVQVKNAYHYVHRVTGQWLTRLPSLLRSLSTAVPTNSLLEYAFVANRLNDHGIFGSYYIYPRRARIVRLSETAAATKVQRWFRQLYHNHDLRYCLRAMIHAQTFHNQRPHPTASLDDLTTLHLALALHLSQVNHLDRAELYYEYATRMALCHVRRRAVVALVVCCSCIFWLATEVAPICRRRALLLLQRFVPHLVLDNVYSIEFLFYQPAYLREPTHPVVVESFALFLDLLSHKPERALDLYEQAIELRPAPTSPLHHNYAKFRRRFPMLVRRRLPWSARPLAVDPRYVPQYDVPVYTRFHNAAAAFLQRWFRTRKQPYMTMPSVARAILALNTNHFAETHYAMHRHRPGVALTLGLHLHFIQHDVERATAVYKSILATAPTEPFVQCALFLSDMAALQPTRDLVRRWRHLQQHGVDWGPLELTFLRFAIVTQPTRCTAWVHYGHFQQIFREDVVAAEVLLEKAVTVAATNDDKRWCAKILAQFYEQRLPWGISPGGEPSKALFASPHTRAVVKVQSWYRMDYQVPRLPGQSRLRHVYFWSHISTLGRVWEARLSATVLKQTSSDVRAAINAVVAREARVTAVYTLQNWCRTWTRSRHFASYRCMGRHLPQPSPPELQEALVQLFIKGNWRRAQTAFVHAMYTNSGDALAIAGLAVVLDAQGHHQVAEKWQQCLARLPARGDAAALLLLHSHAALTLDSTLWWRWLTLAACLQNLSPHFEVVERVYDDACATFQSPILTQVSV